MLGERSKSLFPTVDIKTSNCCITVYNRPQVVHYASGHSTPSIITYTIRCDIRFIPFVFSID